MTDPISAPAPQPAGQRADAQRNYERILAVAPLVIAEQGTQASLRDIARRAGVGLGTLYRNFPTRDALLETLLRQRFDALAARADALAGERAPAEALTVWLDEFTRGSATYRGLPASMMASLADEQSALHASCLNMRAAAARLLERAQDAGDIRPDIDGTDLFALVNAVGWIAEQTPALAGRRERLLGLVMEGLARDPLPGRDGG